MEKGMAAVGRGCDRVRSPFRKRAAAADRTVGTGRGPDRNCVLLGDDGQRRDAGGVPLVVGRVVEIDAAKVGVWLKGVRARIDREGDGVR